jgi:hypothetical protein
MVAAHSAENVSAEIHYIYGRAPPEIVVTEACPKITNHGRYDTIELVRPENGPARIMAGKNVGPKTKAARCNRLRENNRTRNLGDAY